MWIKLECRECGEELEFEQATVFHGSLKIIPCSCREDGEKEAIEDLEKELFEENEITAKLRRDLEEREDRISDLTTQLAGLQEKITALVEGF